MRLYNTLSRQLEELPPPPGPIRMYFCGPTVYQRAHIGNARPFLLGMWLRDWLRYRGYDATLVHNITDVNDKIYDAAPGASAELAARATAVVPRGHRRLRARATRCAAEGDRAHSGDRPVHRGADRARQRVRGRGRRLLPRRERPRLRPVVGAAARPGGGAGAERAEGGPARLRALEGEQARRGHRVGLAVGPRAARLAHRVLGDGRGGARAGVRAARRRARSRLPAPRERARAIERARSSLRAHLDAQRDARVRRREDVEVARQRRLDPQRARHVGERGRAALLPDGALAQADRLHRRDARAGEGAMAELRPGDLRARSRRSPPSGGRRSRRRSTTTSTRPRRSPCCTSGGARASSSCSTAGSASSGSGFVPETPPDEVQALARERAEARARGDWGRSDALREQIAALGWVVQDGGDGWTLVPR